MLRHNKLVSWVAIASLAVLAIGCKQKNACDPSEEECSEDSEDNGAHDDDDKADRLVPGGNDKGGWVRVVRADGAALGLQSIGSPILRKGATTLEFDKKYRVAAGAVELSLLAQARYAGLAAIDITVGKESLVELGGLHLVEELEIGRLKTAVGESVRWEHAGMDGQILDAATQAGQFVPMFPGKRRFDVITRLAHGPEVTVKSVELDFAPGEIKSIAMPYDPTGHFKVVAPLRELPTAGSPAQLFASVHDLAAVRGWPWSTRHLNLTKTSINSKYIADDVDYRVLGSDLTVVHYYVWVNGSLAEVKANAGATVDLGIKRLDVTDVEVEQEDGSIVTTRGMWSIATVSATGTKETILANIPTGRGVDLLAGQYVATVTWTALDGSVVSEDYDVELK